MDIETITENYKVLTRDQKARLRACRKAGRECAFRTTLIPAGRERKNRQRIPAVCGFIIARTECRKSTV